MAAETRWHKSQRYKDGKKERPPKTALQKQRKRGHFCC